MQPNAKLPKLFGDYTGPSKVVLSLIDGLYNQGYKVVLDNLYTSPELLRALIENGTDSFGTLRRKQGLPFGFCEWKPPPPPPPKSYLSSLPPISEFCGDMTFRSARNFGSDHQPPSNFLVFLYNVHFIDKMRWVKFFCPKNIFFSRYGMLKFRGFSTRSKTCALLAYLK